MIIYVIKQYIIKSCLIYLNIYNSFLLILFEIIYKNFNIFIKTL